MAGVLYDFLGEPGAVLSAASGAVVLRKAEKCLAENRIVLCAEYSSTFRRVLKCSPQSTLARSARPVAVFGFSGMWRADRRVRSIVRYF